MYAILEIAGKQYKAEADKTLYVDKLEGSEGDKVSFDNVLLLDNDGKISVGAPNVKGAKATGKIVDQVKADKVVVFKKKRRKGYKKKNGHRQQYTKVLIENISA
jgi:large subunit ribosomal protein L21